MKNQFIKLLTDHDINQYHNQKDIFRFPREKLYAII